MKALLIFSLTAVISSSAFSQAGSLDSSFGFDGTVTTDIQGAYDFGKAIAIQADGKILVGGHANTGNSVVTIIRYNDDGSLDSTFDSDGILTTPFTGGFLDIEIQPDGKILAAGIHEDDFVLARCDENGIPDNSFGTGGIVIADFSNQDNLYSMALQTDGKIVVAGSTDAYFTVTRFLPDGILDSSFGSSGVVITFPGGAASVIIQPDGKIVAAGFSFSSNATTIRLNADGSFDTSFGTGGITSVEDLAGTADVLLQPDGKMLMVGPAYFNGYYIVNSGIARLSADGIIDSTFGIDGISIFQVNGENTVATAAVLQPDGKIVIACDYLVPDFYEAAIARFNADGTFDGSFGNGGVAAVQFGGEYEYQESEDVILDASGRILMAGIHENDFAVARLLADPVFTGTNTYPKEDNYHLYPNPVEDIVFFEYELEQATNVSLQLSDLTGIIQRAFFSEIRMGGKYEEELHLEGIASGIYLLQLKSGEKTVVAKIIKE